MRKILLASGTLMGVAISSAAFAQQTPPTAAPGNAMSGGTATSGMTAGSTPQQPASPTMNSSQSRQAVTGTRPGNVIGTGNSEPTSSRASNITTADTRSTIAPRLPVPLIAESSDPRQFLQVAATALQRNRTGEAQEALERAETRLLDRSTVSADANVPDQGPMISQITSARDALARGDRAQAKQIIEQALAQSPGMSGATMSNRTPAGMRMPDKKTGANGTSM